MTTRPAPMRLGRGILILVSFAAGALVSAIAGSALIVYVPYASVGAILAIRRPGNTLGWLLTAIAWSFALSWLPVLATAQELQALAAPPVVLVIAWFKWWWSLPLVLALVAVLAIVFPTGRLPSGAWRRPAQLLMVTLATITLIAAVLPVAEVSPGDAAASFLMPNPLRLVPQGPPGTEPGGLPTWLTGLPGFALLVASIASMLVRYVRSSGIERLQLQWLVAGLASVVIAVPGGFVLFALLGPESGGLVWVPAIVAFTLPPIAIGIAILRYRLYEIDRIISRTVGWAIVSGVLVAVFAGLVLGLQAALAGFTQGQTLSVAASTLVAFALFQPIRRRVQRAVDRRFDRARYDGERTAAAFAERLRSQVDLVGLEADITGTVGAALRPTSTGLWIRSPGPGPER